MKNYGNTRMGKKPENVFDESNAYAQGNQRLDTVNKNY